MDTDEIEQVTDDTEEEIDIKDFTVRQSGVSLGIYIFLDVFFLFLFCLALFNIDYENPNNIKGMFMLVPVIIFFPLFTFIWFRWKITVKDDQITVRPRLGRKETFTFDYITKLKRKTVSRQFVARIECFTAYNGSRELFTVTSYCPNLIVFVALLVAKGVDIEWENRETNEYWIEIDQELKRLRDNNEK